MRDQRQGFGICKFADGFKFKGEWEGDAWLQSLAHPRLTKAKGLGLSRAQAGTPASFTILVCLSLQPWCPSGKYANLPSNHGRHC